MICALEGCGVDFELPKRKHGTNQKFCSKMCQKRAKARRHALANRSEEKARAKAYRAANPDKERDRHLRSRYGLTLLEWQVLLSSQDGRCAMCRTTQPGKKGWHTDHDHLTGRVRGILCSNCNTGLGFIEDANLVGMAKAYLSKGEPCLPRT